MPDSLSSATKEFGRRLRAEREELCATQRQVSEAAEIDESTYRKIELGQRNPNLHNMIRIADALGVDLAVLTEGLNADMVPPPRERTSPREPLEELKRKRDAKRRARA